MKRNQPNGSVQSPKPPEKDVMVIFRAGAVVATVLVLLEGACGPVLNTHYPSLVPLGGTPLAEFGLVMGTAYLVAEVVRRKR